MVVGLAAVVGGCQRYQARPLDMGAHRAAFLSRTPDSPEVAAFAKGVSTMNPGGAITFDPADGLTLAEGEAVALVFNGGLRLARLRAGVSAADAEHAGLWEDPVLSTDLTRIIQSTDHPWKVFGTVGFTIPLSGRLAVAKKLAADEHQADIVRAWAQEWSTRIELRRRWVEWSSALERAAVLKGFLDRLDQIVSVVDRVAAAGEMTRVESRLFKVERATRAAELAALESEAAEAELAIRTSLGLPPSGKFALTPALLLNSGQGADLAEAPEPTDANTDLAVARAEYVVAERSLELEIRKQYPDLTIGPGVGREDGQEQILLGLSIPLPLLNRNRQGIATAKAERELTRAMYETAYERVYTDLAGARLRLRAAAEQRQLFERDVVPLIDEQYAESRRIAELGEINTLLLLETLVRQLEAKVRLLEAHAAESLARIKVDELIGPAAEPPAPPSPEQGATP
jgi:cobalt-zinc-cadmium efflux system outer membrane protein